MYLRLQLIIALSNISHDIKYNQLSQYLRLVPLSGRSLEGTSTMD